MSTIGGEYEGRMYVHLVVNLETAFERSEVHLGTAVRFAGRCSWRYAWRCT